MAKYTFTSDLSVSGIDSLIKELENYKKNTLQNKIELFTRKLAEYGVEQAKLHIVDMDAIFTSELVNSIIPHRISGGNGTCVFYVQADSEHAAFVEFGTGYVGQSNPYPYPLPQGITWEYLVGRQVLANAREGVYGWFYAGKDGKVYFTDGMESRPYMYETYLDLMNNVLKIVKEVFR